MSSGENFKFQTPNSRETPNSKLQKNARQWSTPYSGGKGEGRSETDEEAKAEKEESSAGIRRTPDASRVVFAFFIITALVISLICGCKSNPYGVTKPPYGYSN